MNQPVTASEPINDTCFRLAMESAGVGMAIVSLDGHWLEVNAALCRLLGYPADALVGREGQDVSHPDDVAVSPALMQTLLAGAADAVEGERRCLHAGGDVIEVLENGALMRDEQGAPQYFIAHLSDVTARRQAERALRDRNTMLEQRLEQATAALEAANRRMETFSQGVSHDLRAPLRAIEGFINLLDRHAGKALDDRAQGDLQRIRAASQRMGGLIDSLLELTRIGQAELRPTSVDVSLLTEWVAAELQDAQPERSAQVTVQPGLDLIGDERLLKMLFTQLLRNAWQFSAKRPQVQVAVEGSRSPDGLELVVRDQGIGFDMVYAGKLFEPFQRLHGIEDGAGSGIGLSIAQQVVARHGGKIWAEATPDKGATFHVTLHDLQVSESTAA